MEQESIILNTVINTGDAKESITSVRAELRKLTNEMANLEVGSKEFNRAAQRAGELKDRMKDAQQAVASFNPEAKFAAFSTVLGTVANSFSAVQGAMAIFGTENKDLEKMILRTQGAIAVAKIGRAHV